MRITKILSNLISLTIVWMLAIVFVVGCAKGRNRRVALPKGVAKAQTKEAKAKADDTKKQAKLEADTKKSNEDKFDEISKTLAELLDEDTANKKHLKLIDTETTFKFQKMKVIIKSKSIKDLVQIDIVTDGAVVDDKDYALAVQSDNSIFNAISLNLQILKEIKFDDKKFESDEDEMIKFILNSKRVSSELDNSFKVHDKKVTDKKYLFNEIVNEIDLEKALSEDGFKIEDISTDKSPVKVYVRPQSKNTLSIVITIEKKSVTESYVINFKSK